MVMVSTECPDKKHAAPDEDHTDLEEHHTDLKEQIEIHDTLDA